MAIVPSKLAQRLAWYRQHVGPWSTNAVAIGSTTTDVDLFETKLAAAEAAVAAAEAARAASLVATQGMRTAMGELDAAAQGIIKQVRGKYDLTGDLNVFTLAAIPEPATPGTVGGPGLPYEFTVTVGQNGALELKWKCNNPPGCVGVLYQVWRRVNGVGEFTYCGGTGERTFIDATLPTGTTNVTYQLQGVRSSSIGPWAQFNVNFGSPAPGMTTGSVSVTATAVTPGTPRMAA